MDQDTLYFNGINGATGDYALPPMRGEDLAKVAQGEAPAENLNELRYRHRQSDTSHYGIKAGLDPKQLDQAGWGIIFPHDAAPELQEALRPLLALRQEQAGERFRIYVGADGYRPGESKNQFLSRHQVGPGPADPERMPYYLLLVGSPEAIPYSFQYQLDVQYAVGRIQFDALEAYAHYAQSVVQSETSGFALPRKAALFGVENPDDKATQLSSQGLILPLENYLRQQEGWELSLDRGEAANKARLQQLLGGDDTPALLFTASHGMAFPENDPRQLPHQGALLCQDWPGPRQWQNAIPQDFYLAADDIGDSAKLLGLISFHFACYGAGTPRYDEFSKQAFKERGSIAPHAFLAALPQRLLSHPGGGALATIGHVERAWGYSFLWPGAGVQTAVFESVLQQLLDGYPVGAAFEFFNERYAELSSDLSSQLEQIDYGLQFDPYELAGMWGANNDARSYVILGDPAVRMHCAATAEARPRLAPVSVNGSPAPTPDTASTLPPVTDATPTTFSAPAAETMSTEQLRQRLSTECETLHVRTYCSAEPEQAVYAPAQARFENARLCAQTRVGLDFNPHTVIPEDLPPAVWQAHKDSLALALQSRNDCLRILLATTDNHEET